MTHDLAVAARPADPPKSGWRAMTGISTLSHQLSANFQEPLAISSPFISRTGLDSISA